MVSKGRRKADATEDVGRDRERHTVPEHQNFDKAFLIALVHRPARSGVAVVVGTRELHQEHAQHP